MKGDSFRMEELMEALDKLEMVELRKKAEEIMNSEGGDGGGGVMRGGVMVVGG